MKNRIIAIIIIAIILSAATLLTMNISDKEEKVESIISTTTQQIKSGYLEPDKRKVRKK